MCPCPKLGKKIPCSQVTDAKCKKVGGGKTPMCPCPKLGKPIPCRQVTKAKCKKVRGGDNEECDGKHETEDGDYCVCEDGYEYVTVTDKDICLPECILGDVRNSDTYMCEPPQCDGEFDCSACIAKVGKAFQPVQEAYDDELEEMKSNAAIKFWLLLFVLLMFATLLGWRIKDKFFGSYDDERLEDSG
jgi:hypothetical protein